MNRKRRKARGEARAETKPEEERPEERIEAEPLTEEEVQKRMSELFRLTDVQGDYGFNDTGIEYIRAQLRLIDDYIAIARMKADITEAQIYLRIEELRQL